VHLEHQKSIDKWQRQWDDSNKGRVTKQWDGSNKGRVTKQWDGSNKGRVTKEYFPEFKERLKEKINISPNFTAMVTAHGKTKAYLHRFKIIQSSECVCANCDQTVDHLIFDCPKQDKEREKLIAYTSREEDWPVRKSDLVNKHLNQFKQFINSIDFEKL
jgi:hypothetical protein